VTSVRWDIDENNHHNNTANDVSFLTSETTNHSNGGRRRPRLSHCNCPSKCSLCHFLHVWDIVLTTFWIIFAGYHLYYNKGNEKSRSVPMLLLLAFSIVLTVLNALRGFLWIWASLPSLGTIFCGCCFVDDDIDNEGVSTVSKLATNLTMLLGILYGGLSGAAWSGPSSWLPWCDGLGLWCSELISSHTVMPIALSIASAIELIRWVYLRGQLSLLSSNSVERARSSDYYNDDFSSSPSENSRHRPWWIGGHSSNRRNANNDGLNDPLLESGATANRQPSWATPSWFPFRTGRSSNDGDNGVINGDEEDVGSVLDSLGEDWASRAESDPYWWTR